MCPMFEPVFELGMQVGRPWVTLAGCIILECDKGIGIYIGIFACAFTRSVAREIGLSVERQCEGGEVHDGCSVCVYEVGDCLFVVGKNRDKAYVLYCVGRLECCDSAI